MANLVDRSVPGEARWQVRWKATREAPGRSQTFASDPVARGRSQAQRDAERLRAYVESQSNACDVEEALVALGFVDVVTRQPGQDVTLAEWAERWVVARPGVTARTQHDYDVALHRHILPTLGDIQLAMATL